MVALKRGMLAELPAVGGRLDGGLAATPEKAKMLNCSQSSPSLPSLGKVSSVASLPMLPSSLVNDSISIRTPDARRAPKWRSAELASLAAAQRDLYAPNAASVPSRKRDLRKGFRESRMPAPPSQKRSMARLAPLPPPEDASQHWANERLKMVRGTHRIEGGIQDCTRIRRELVGLREQMLQALDVKASEASDSGELVTRLERAIHG